MDGSQLRGHAAGCPRPYCKDLVPRSVLPNSLSTLSWQLVLPFASSGCGQAAKGCCPSVLRSRMRAAPVLCKTMRGLEDPHLSAWARSLCNPEVTVESVPK